MSTTTSTFVSHQGLQSCLDPFLLQPRVIFHQLSPQTPPPPLSTLPFPKKQPETPLEKIPENDKNYVHPLIKNSSTSSSCLSLKSLEMCTESLGSETGSGIDLKIDELSYHIHDDDDVMEKQSNAAARIEKAKAKKGGNNFPPPLSSIAGGDGVQVQTRREGGRLVIKAFSFSSSATYFRAEREDGRLRLSLLKDSNFFEAENDELEDEQVNGDEAVLCICEESDDDVDDDVDNEEEEEEEEEEDSNGGFWKVGGVNGGGDQWSTSSRWCNGGTTSRKRLPSLPFCVAIS
ncbi:hypothetical protein ABFX02_04G028600 [Erythranthe guttata]